MADLKIKVTAFLDETLSKSQLQSQLNKIAKDLKVTVGIDAQQLKDLDSAIKKIQNQTNGKKVKIVDDGDVSKVKELYTSVDKAVEHYKQFGQVKINKIFDPLTKELQGFNLEVQRADGLIDKLKFKSAELTGMHGVGGFALTGQNQIDNTSLQTQKALSQMMQNRAKEERKLAEEQAKAINKTIELNEKEKQKQKEVSEEIRHQISLLQQKMQIEAKNLNRRYSNSVDKTALKNQLSQVMSVDPSSFKSMKEFRRWQDQVSLGFKDIAANARTSSSHVLTLGEAFKTAMTRFPVWMAASTVFFQSFNFLKDGIAYINELNVALTEVSIVTGKSQEQVAQLGEEYNKLAQSMGVTTAELSKAAASLFRQGLSQDQVSQRMKTIIEYSKISSLDIQTATEIMTAAINSMGVTAERAADVWSYLGDATATGADEIGRAFKKVGGTAGALNINFEKVSSWISVISSRTRESAETIGQSVKSILARVQSLKETGFDEEDGTQINQVAKALNEVGVQLTDNQGQFRNFGTVLDEVGARWKDLDSRQKAYLATTIAGTYQQSRFLNLMEGYGDSVDLYAKAMDSAGTASKKFELYQQGTQAQLDKLKASIESVWMEMFNSSGINTVISSLNGITSAFKSITDNIGALAPIFGIAGVSILAFNGGLKSIMTTGTATIAVLRGIPLGLTSMDSALAASTLKARLFGMAVNGTGIALKGLKTALVSTTTFVAGAIFPMAAFMAVGYAIQKVTEAIMEQREEAKKLKQEQDDIVKKYASHSEQIDKLASEYENLSAQVKNGQLDKNSEVYVNNMNELGKLMPSLVKSTNEHGDSIIRSVDAVKEELKYAKELKDNYAQMAVANFEKDLDKQASKVDDILAKIEGYKNDKKPIVTGKVATPVSQGDKLYADRQIIGQERELQLLLAQSGTYLNEKAKAIMEVEGISSKLSESNQKLVQSFINEAVASKKSVEDGEDFKQFLSDTTNKAVDFAAKLAKIPEALVDVFSTKQVNKLSKDQIQALKSINDNLENGGSGWEYYKQSLLNVGFSSKQADSIIKELTKSTRENADEVANDTIKQQELAKAIEEATKQYDDSISKIEELSKTLYELDSKQGLSADTISMIANKYPELLAYINDEKTLREKLAGAIDAEKNIANDAMVQKLSTNEKFFSEAKKLNSEYFNTLADFYGIDLENTTTLAQLKFQVEAKLMEKLGDAWATYYDAQAMSFTAAGKAMMATMSYAEAVNSPQLKAIADYESSMKSITSTMRNFTAESNYSAGITATQTKALEDVSKANDKANKSTENSIYVSDKYKQALEEINAELEKYQAILKEFPDYSKEYRDALGKEIDLLKEKKQLIQDQAKSLESQIKSGKIQQYGMISGSSKTTSSYASGGSNESQIWNFFKSKGFSDSIVAGIMGNLQLESGLKTTALNKSSGAFGLAQWLGGRKKGLQNFAANRGTDASDLDTQLSWLWQELNGSEKRTLNWLLSNQNASASTAAAQFDRLFERSEGTSIAGRQRYANQFLSKYSGSGGGYVASGSEAETSQNVDQAKSDLLGLQQDILDVNAQIKELEFALINSEISAFDHTSSQLNSQVEYDKKRMELWTDDFVFQKAMISDQAVQYQKLIDNIDKERSYILDQIASGKLDAAQKEELLSKLSDLNNEYIEYQINLKNTNTELVDLLKAQKDKINEESDAFIEAYKAFYEKKREIDQKAYDDQMALIDKQESERDYNKDLKERQKGIEELKQQIAALSMDDSQKGKLADLQKQLAEQQDGLGEFTHDKEIEDRKNNLEEQKKLNDEYYDNLLNDERNFAKMKEDILAGNIQKYQDMMSQWKDSVLANLDEIGESIGNNLIDQLTNATKGLEDAKSQVSDLNTVHSSGGKPDVSGTDTSQVDQVTILSDVPLLKKTENGYELSGTILKKGQIYKAYGVDEKDGVYSVGGGYVTADPTVTKYQKFHDGGIVGKTSSTNKMTEIVNKLFNVKPGEQVVKSLIGELQVPPKNIPNFFTNINNMMSALIPKQSITSSGGNTFNINFKVDKMTGNQQDVEFFLNKIVKGVNSMGMNM